MNKVILLQLLEMVFGIAGIAAWYLKNTLMTGISLLAMLLMLGISLFLSMKSKKLMDFLVVQTRPQKPETASVEQQLLQQKLTLMLFESQINPHFLYNTLDSIRGQALVNHQEEIASMTEKLSQFFRYCISSKGNIVKISEEIRNVQDYFCIQRYRFGDRIQMSIDIEDEEVLDYYIPKLTLQPIVENAIAHGIEEYTGRGHVWIRLLKTDHKIYLHVIDDGGGMEMDALLKLRRRLEQGQIEVPSNQGRRHSGIAIQNVNARIQVCFGSEYGLNYRSMKGEGTDVEIVLPLVDDFARANFENRLKGTM